jgi:hypothetical protein
MFEEFLKHYHNNLPDDWLYEKREVVARLIKEYTERALRIHDVVGRSEQLLEEQSNWLMANTSLEVEKVVDFKEHFK